MQALNLPAGGHGFWAYLFVTHTHILFVDRLNFLTASGVVMFQTLKKGSKLRAKRAAVVVRGFSTGKGLEGTPFRMM